MSYGPPPSLVGTIFTDANNSPIFNDPSLGSDTCNCTGGGGPGNGGGGGGGGGSCNSGSSPGGGGDGPITLPGQGPVIDSQPPQGNSLTGLNSPNIVIAGRPDPGCGIIHAMGLPLSPDCQVTTPPGVPPGCVTLATRIALFPEGCKVAGEVEVGDILLTRRPDGALAGERVSSLRISLQPCVLLETEDGSQLHCSLSHEVMVADPTVPQGRRTVVTALTLAERLLTEDGTPVALRSMVRQPDGQVILISLAGPEHIYLSDGLWSHNATKGIVTWPLSPA